MVNKTVNPFRPGDPHHRLVETLCTSLRRRQIVGSRNVGTATAALIHNIVDKAKFTTFEQLIAIIKDVCRLLIAANPKELASSNVVRRILKLIREEYNAAAAAHLSAPPSLPETPFLGPTTPGINVPSTHYLSNDLQFKSPSPTHSSPATLTRALPTPLATPYHERPAPFGMDRQTSLSNFVAMRHSRAQLERGASGSVMDLSSSTSNLFMSPARNSSAENMGAILSRANSNTEDFMRHSQRLRPLFTQAIQEVQGELETTHEDVAKGAKEHIHSSEVILTLGHSKTVEAFLKSAFKDRKFTVIVAESAPTFLGHSMANALSDAGIPTIIVPDTSIFALMPRITKVILGSHTVLANGGLFALSGSLSAALAAKAHSKPVVVTTGQFKFAPAWNLYHEFSAVDFQSPGAILGFDGDGGGGGFDGAEGLDPYYEYIKPELINLFVTNEGDHSPSYIYRLIKEAYDDNDAEL